MTPTAAVPAELLIRWRSVVLGIFAELCVGNEPAVADGAAISAFIYRVWEQQWPATPTRQQLRALVTAHGLVEIVESLAELGRPITRDARARQHALVSFVDRHPRVLRNEPCPVLFVASAANASGPDLDAAADDIASAWATALASNVGEGATLARLERELGLVDGCEAAE